MATTKQCDVTGCSNLARSDRASLCGMHLMRQRRAAGLVGPRSIAEKRCDYPDCAKAATSERAHYCGTHEMRVRRWGSVELEGHRDYTPLTEIWQQKIEVTPFGCWNWPHLSPEGYGFASDGRKVWMHRWVWTQLVSAISTGMELDHLCRNSACCNPDHLEVVTGRVNKQRQRSANAAKTHCPRGHEYIPENTILGKNKKNGVKRSCRICSYAASAAYRERKASLIQQGGGD